MTKRPRVLALSSAGGHWVQLLRLMPAWEGCDLILATTDLAVREQADQMAARCGMPPPRLLKIIDANRWQKLRALRSVLGIALILLRYRPDAVVTTGAAPGYFALRIGKMLGARTIWLDSIANAEEISLSGRKVKPYADLWLTQWPHLARPGGPSCRGAVL